jgi:DNA-binding transcriptional ArsR family regulator
VSADLPDSRYAAVLDALGDPSRREIVALLANGRASVGELAEQLPISRPAVSLHLKVLREAGIVASDSKGTRNIYFLTPDGIQDARAFFDRLWSAVLDDLRREAEDDR